MDAERRVSLKSTCIVTPASPTSLGSRRTSFMSNLDQVFASQTWYINTVWYFRPESKLAQRDPRLISQELQTSLSKVLVEYPVLAGRVTRNSNGRLEVSLNDKGVIFREALTDASFSDWEDMKDCSIEQQLNPQDTLITDYESAPLIRIQFTAFSCGGIALGCSTAHGTEDGWAAIEFMKSWSEVHLGLPISTPPVHATHMLKARTPPVVSVPIKDYISAPRTSQSTIQHQIPESSVYQALSFRFTEEQVTNIIKEVESGPWKLESSRVSSFIAMAAFTWKVITEARELPDNTITRYVYPVSCRQRWQPPLPRGYFGNSAHVSSLPARAGDIKREHVSFAAKLIHEDLRNTTGEYLRSIIDWMEIELSKKDRDIRFACDDYSGADLQGTSVVYFPIFKVDFGWGAPVHHSFTFEPVLGDGHAYLFPTPEGGKTRLVFIYMKRSAMEKLLRNELFRKFHPSERN